MSAQLTPVVLLHSSGSSGAQWRALVAQLAARRRVFAPNLIGYGGVPVWMRPSSYSLAHEAAQVSGLLATLRAPVHLVGHSFGGAVALHIARTRPEAVCSLTVIEPVAFHLLRSGHELELIALDEIKRVAGEVVAAHARAEYDAGFARFTDYWNGPGTWNAMPEDKRAALAPLLGKVVLDFQATMNEEAGPQEMAAITASTLVLQGERTVLPARLICRRLAASIPGATMAIVPGAGHMSPVTHRDQVNALIEAHIERVERSLSPVQGGGVMLAADQRQAWLMVAACAAMVAMAFGAVTVLAVFLTPLAAEFGWPRGDLSLAYAVATIGTGLGGILMGHYADRVSVRHVALCGAIVPGLALLCLSQMHTKGELYGYQALMGVFGIGACLAPLSSLASQWLTRNPGLAIGIVSAGGALGQGLIPFFARNLVVLEGWRYTYLAMGLAYLLLAVPLALVLRAAPRAAVLGAVGAGAVASNPYARPRGQMLAWLSLAALLCCVCMATPIVHVASLGSDRGLGGRDAAGLLAVMMICAMVGRVTFGRISDRVGSLQTYMIASLGQTLLAFLFPHARTGTELYVLSALFGLIYSGAQTGFILCAREYAPAGATARSIGIVMSFAWLGMALGAWQGGVFYDLCGDYVPSFTNAALGGAANLLILALLYVHTANKPLTIGRFKWQFAKS